MTHDQLTIIWTTAAWSGGVAVVGGVLIWLGRRASVRWLTVGVAMVAVLAVLAGTLATSRKMFLSQHDLGVVGAGGDRGGDRGAGLRARGRLRPGPVVARPAGAGARLR